MNDKREAEPPRQCVPRRSLGTRVSTYRVTLPPSPPVLRGRRAGDEGEDVSKTRSCQSFLGWALTPHARPLSPDYRGEGSEEIVLGVSTRPLAPAGEAMHRRLLPPEVIGACLT